MGAMDETYDKQQIRCRRLGHQVPFGYCRLESDGQPCRLVRDCWWERFDIHTYLRENFPAEVCAAFEAECPPPDKTLSLVEIIRQAQQRLAARTEADAPPQPSDAAERQE